MHPAAAQTAAAQFCRSAASSSAASSSAVLQQRSQQQRTHRSKTRKRNENRANIERKSIRNRSEIDQQSTQNAPGGPRGNRGRCGGLRERSRDTPGDARRALGTPPEHLGTPPDAPRRPQSDRKVRPGGPESTFLSVLFGQLFARCSRSDIRTFLGRSGEAWTSDSIAPASVS